MRAALGLFFVVYYGALLNAETAQPRVREATTSLVRGLTDKVDDLFGTERRDENSQFSTLRLSARHRIVDGLPATTNYAVRLMLRPATFQQWSDQVNHWLKRKKDKLRNRWQTERVESEGSIPSTQSEDTPERDPWRPAFEHRFRLDQRNIYEGRLKVTKDVEWRNTLNHLVYDVRWSNQRRWESVLSMISSYSLSDTLLLQFNNAAQWQITGRTLESSHGPVLAYTIADDQAISFGLTSVLGYNPTWFVLHTLSVLYRRHIYQDWIDFSINPYQSYARSQNFRAETGIVLNVEVIF